MESRIKKIGILAFSSQVTGGVLQYTQSLIDIFDNYDEFQVVVFVFEKDLFSVHKSEVRLILMPERNWYKRSIMMAQCLLGFRSEWILSNNERNLFKDIDFFINPSPALYPNFFLNKPFIFTVQDFQERYYPEFFSKFDRLNRWVVKRALSKSAAHIICESNHVKNDALNFLNISNNKISVIPSPPTKSITEYLFKEDSLSNIKEKYNLPDEYIFYPAQFWKHKNHLRLACAFEKLSKKNDKLFLVLTGTKGNNYLNVMQKIRSLKIENKVLHLGYVDYDDLPYLFKLSKILIMPSLFESISIPIYEAFALSVPVCCSNVVALPEQTQGAAILFDPLSVDDIAYKTQLLLSDDDLQLELSNNGKIIMDNFNFSDYKKNINNLVLKFL